MSDKNKNENVPGHDTQILRAETRTEQAETRTEQAKSRTEEAETRTEQAETRTEQAKTRTEQAETRTEEAETRSENAEAASRTLAAIVDSSDDAIIGKDLNGIISSWNKGAEKIFSYTADEMVGTSIMRLIPADRQDEENQILGKIRRGESVEHFETLRQTKAGRPIDVSVCVSPIKDATGKIIGASKVARDITKRKQAESRIRYLNRVYAVLSDINQTIVREKSPQAMLATACQIAVEKGLFRMAWVGLADESLRHVKLTAHAGATADTLKILPNLLGDESHDCVCGLTLQALQTGVHAICNDIEHDPQAVVWRNDALQRGYRAMASLPLKVEGKVNGTFNIYADETDFFDAEELHLLDEMAMDIGFALELSQREGEHQRAEEARQASESRYRTLFDYAPDGIVIANPDSYYLDANASICRMLGYTRDELIGKHASDIVAPEEIHHIEPALNAIKAKSAYHREWQFRRKDGSVFAAEVIVTAMPDGNLLGLIRDVTERKVAEEKIHQLNVELEQRVAERTAQLKAANEELEAFSYSVSHDLRAPLRHVMGFVELLQKDAGSSLPEKSLRHLAVISQSTKRMGDLIDDLLAFSRIGRAELKKTDVNLDELVGETLEDFRAEITERKIACKINPLPHMQADRALLRLVFVNLISNAVKFTGQRAEAKIEIGCVESDEGQVTSGQSQTALPSTLDPRPSTVIYVRDNGAGFDPQYTHKLFGVFQRLHTQEQFEGTGIGLANVQRIIQRHGGRVWAEGIVDGGATFYFSIPKQNGGGDKH